MEAQDDILSDHTCMASHSKRDNLLSMQACNLMDRLVGTSIPEAEISVHMPTRQQSAIHSESNTAWTHISEIDNQSSCMRYEWLERLQIRGSSRGDVVNVLRAQAKREPPRSTQSTSSGYSVRQKQSFRLSMKASTEGAWVIIGRTEFFE